MRQNRARHPFRIALRLQDLDSTVGVILGVRPALVVEIVQQRDHRPVLFRLPPETRVAAERGLDAEHVLPQALGLRIFSHERPGGVTRQCHHFLTARGAPPPLALARGRRYAALPSGRSLGPQALLTGQLSAIHLHPSTNILHTHHFNHDAFLTPSVELGVEHLLPRAEIERAVGDRDDHLMAHDRALQVRVSVVLAGLVVAVRQPGRRELLQPHLEILDQPILPVVHVDARRNVHRRDERKAFHHGALFHDRGNLVGNPHELLALLRVEPEIVGEYSHAVTVAQDGEDGVHGTRSTRRRGGTEAVGWSPVAPALRADDGGRDRKHKRPPRHRRLCLWSRPPSYLPAAGWRATGHQPDRVATRTLPHGPPSQNAPCPRGSALILSRALRHLRAPGPPSPPC